MKELDEGGCRFGGGRKDNGNCKKPADDGLPAQCVGSWTARKHDHLRLYISATRAARAKYLSPKGRGGAAFIDLFAGPGRVRMHDRSETVEGSPLIVLGHAESPFTRVILCEDEPENIAALRERTAGFRGRTRLVEGDCNAEIARVVREVPERGLNFAFVDPFGPKHLKWTTLKHLASFNRMDLLIHFPILGIRRNFHVERVRIAIDEMLGSEKWRDTVHTAPQAIALIDFLREQLVGLGYDREKVNALPVEAPGKKLIYYLVFASKDPLGTKIWRSITKNDGPQLGLAF